MNRTFLMIGAAFGFTGVALGAFGAHALREQLTLEMLAIYQTGVQYQMLHALALLIVAVAGSIVPRTTGWLFTAGVLIFSGSLYGLALTGTRWLGAVTPIGGICFLAGWTVMFYSAARVKAN